MEADLTLAPLSLWFQFAEGGAVAGRGAARGQRPAGPGARPRHHRPPQQQRVPPAGPGGHAVCRGAPAAGPLRRLAAGGPLHPAARHAH